VTISILWRRLDLTGHDACTLVRGARGWRITGAAAFRSPDGPAHLAYRVAGDDDWRAARGEARGWIGARHCEFAIERTAAGEWSANGDPVPGLRPCLDLDFGFTPATNLFALRRLRLSIGASADAPAAWLDVETGSLRLLAQRYERRSETTYWYEAPECGYEALLEVGPEGFVRQYPGLWSEEG
jgi:hypothetical protein